MEATLTTTKTDDKDNRLKSHGLTYKAFQKLSRQKFTVVCFAVVSFYVLLAILGYLQLLPDFQERVGTSYESPSLEFSKLLGTDIFGRSILYKIFIGAKTGISIGFLVTAISIPVGITLGLLAGYFGGKIDALITWLYTVIVSVPNILLIIGISYVLGKGMLSICIAMGSVSWVGLCRMTRGEVLKHRNKEYVLAVRLLGANHNRVLFKHILPNVFHLAIITGSLMVLGAIKSEVILTYLGVGIQDGASWGTMIADASGELVNGIWWPLAGVSLFMFLLIYSLNVLGDALRDALDPKLTD